MFNWQWCLLDYASWFIDLLLETLLNRKISKAANDKVNFISMMFVLSGSKEGMNLKILLCDSSEI